MSAEIFAVLFGVFAFLLLVGNLGLIALAWRSVGAMSSLAHAIATGAPVAAQLPKSSTAPSLRLPGNAGLGASGNAAPVGAVLDKPVIDPAFVAWLKKQEGFSAKAYPDNKQWSIGYGTRANSHDEVIDEAEADRRLHVEVNEAEKFVESVIPNAPLGVKQAVTELTYNAGPSWATAGLGTKLKAGDYEGAKTNFVAYCHETKEGVLVENAGLKARREESVKWFDKPL